MLASRGTSKAVLTTHTHANDRPIDYKRILEITPNSQLAREAVQRLPAVINEKLERDKAEMLGKLKDLGNVVLGKLFGISLDNLQFQQDPNSGSYSVSMRQ